MKVNAVLDLIKNELQNAVIQKLTGAPSSPVVSQIYTDTTAGSGNEIFYMYIGTWWVEIAFMARVLTKRLDQFASPNTSLAMNSQKITGLADPTLAQDAATKAYVDSLVNGTDWKNSVRVATTANGTLASAFANGQTVDGVVLATGNRILLKDQTAGAENGIYTVNASGAPTRATDADANPEVTAGMAVFVSEGSTNVNSQWKLTTDDTITLGTTALVFAQIGAGTSYTAGTGIDIAWSVISILTTSVPRAYSATFGDGSATSFNIDHNLWSTRRLQVSFIKESNGEPYIFDWTYSTTNRIIVTAPTAPSSNEFRVTVFAITP